MCDDLTGHHSPVSSGAVLLLKTGADSSLSPKCAQHFPQRRDLCLQMRDLAALTGREVEPLPAFELFLVDGEELGRKRLPSV